MGSVAALDLGWQASMGALQRAADRLSALTMVVVVSLGLRPMRELVAARP